MNLSNLLAVLLYISSFPILQFQPSLILPDLCFKSSTFQSCYSVTELRSVTPVLFGIAKVEIFLLLSSFLFLFFAFLFPKLLNFPNDNNLYFQLLKSTFSSSLSLFPFLRSGMQK
jgi:hypothetical protein